jgi:acetate kinase
MANADRTRILTINAGSSSLKAAIYDMDRAERLMLAVPIERIGQSCEFMHVRHLLSTS